MKAYGFKVQDIDSAATITEKQSTNYGYKKRHKTICNCGICTSATPRKRNSNTSVSVKNAARSKKSSARFLAKQMIKNNLNLN